MGTSIEIYLPRAHGTVNRVEPDNGKVIDLPRGKETILVVDDETSLTDVTATMLRRLGYKTYCAHSGEQALQVLDRHDDIDLLFTDIVMPGGMDGYDLAQAVRYARPSLRILLASGFAADPENNLYDDGYARELADSLLNKPYNEAELARAVSCTLNSSQR